MRGLSFFAVVCNFIKKTEVHSKKGQYFKTYDFSPSFFFSL